MKFKKKTERKQNKDSVFKSYVKINELAPMSVYVLPMQNDGDRPTDRNFVCFYPAARTEIRASRSIRRAAGGSSHKG